MTFNKPEIVLNSPEAIIGYRVGIWWPRSYCFFYGDIVSYQNGKHKLSYDDGQSATVNLLKHQIHWYDDKFGFAYAFAAADNKPIDLSALEGEDITMVRETKMVKVYGKDLPPNKPPKREAAIGWRVGLLWHEDQTYYYGVVNSYDPATKLHLVLYDDATCESLDLSKTKVQWLEQLPLDSLPKLAPASGLAPAQAPQASKRKAKAKKKPSSSERGKIGQRVGIFWPDDACFYYGKIIGRNKDGTHHLEYDDGMRESLNLSKEKVNWEAKA